MNETHWASGLTGKQTERQAGRHMDGLMARDEWMDSAKAFLYVFWKL